MFGPTGPDRGTRLYRVSSGETGAYRYSMSFWFVTITLDYKEKIKTKMEREENGKLNSYEVLW